MRELSFRFNFFARLITHVLWLSLMLVFLSAIFRHTQRIGDWNQSQLLFFVGTYLTLNATVNCLFMSGCSRLSELIRTGNLDFELLKPVDEQFLLTCQRIDWALAPQILLGLALCGVSSIQTNVVISPGRVLSYLALLGCSVTILYSVLVTLAAISVWTVRHEELYELWFYLLQFGNYPDEIYRTHPAGQCLRIALTYAIPILLAVNVPARYGAVLLDDWRPIATLAGAAVLVLAASRAFFKFALRSYTSAGS